MGIQTVVFVTKKSLLALKRLRIIMIILVAGERCNITEITDFMPEYKNCHKISNICKRIVHSA